MQIGFADKRVHFQQQGTCEIFSHLLLGAFSPPPPPPTPLYLYLYPGPNWRARPSAIVASHVSPVSFPLTGRDAAGHSIRFLRSLWNRQFNSIKFSMRCTEAFFFLTLHVPCKHKRRDGPVLITMETLMISDWGALLVADKKGGNGPKDVNCQHPGTESL